MHNFKRISLGTLLVVFCFITISGSLIASKPAKAQMPTAVVTSVPDTLSKVLTQVYEGLKIAVMNAAVQGVSYFTEKIAYDAAVYIASGGSGQGALVFKDGFGDYLKNTASAAGSKAVGELTKPLGLNLCKVPDIKLDIALKTSLQKKTTGGGQAPTPPECTFQDMKMFDADAWESKYFTDGDFDTSKMFNFSLDHVEEGDLGIYLTASEKIGSLMATEQASAELTRVAGQGVKAVSNVISGKIETPSSIIKGELDSVGPAKKQAEGKQSFGDTFASGMYQIIPSTLSTFVNTLLSQGLSNLMGGLFPSDDGASTGSGAGVTGVLNPNASGAVGGRRQAEAMFSRFLIPKTTAIDKYNILGDFSNCPDIPGINNCVIDTSFVSAVQEADYGKPVTIEEAISKNWLHATWKLIPPSNYSLNSDPECHNSAYCYSNIKKLRKARILPLGFEIAALNSNPDKPWTLDQVQKGFYNCNYIKDANGKVTGIINDPTNYPFCHLIDPDWVLKAPLTRCEAQGYTNNLLSTAGPQRQKECVDTSTCVKFDDQGNCLSYAYCVREKNVWRIDGDKCESQYATCLSYTDSKNKVVSYLHRTLDNRYCNEGTVGCSTYSLKRDMLVTSTVSWYSGPFSTLEDGTNAMIYFNKNVSTNCASGSAGCSAFKIAATPSTVKHYKKAPTYLGCYDTDKNIDGIQWPVTRADLALLTPHKDCDDYAQVCVKDEENCNWYTELLPASSGRTATKIPGRYKPATTSITATGVNQVTWNDQCDASCSGYDAYREMSTRYSSGQDVVYIIPTSTAFCQSTQSGCAGFTNLSTTDGNQEKIEYFSYLRPCINPDKTKQKTFYTYEGSSQGGFQLKVFTLEKDPATGAPKQFVFNNSSAEKNRIQACQDGSLYKVDSHCREFNDDSGKIYYALLDKAIAVDQSCTPYRFNSSDMYENTDLTSSATCTSGGGNWNIKEGVCYSCFQGGRYSKGFCFYDGLPSGVTNAAESSVTCSASVESCRPYKGNAGNNIRSVFTDDFENSSTTVALAGWNTGSVLSVESTYVGGHSLGFAGTNGIGTIQKTLNTTSTILTPGKSYNVNFWAKTDNSKALDVYFTDGTSNTKLGQVALDDAWNYYQLGPIELKGTDKQSLSFAFQYSGSGNKVFLDNIEVIEVTDYIYLVKDKLDVPGVCDSRPNDKLPGEALGCKPYTNPSGKTVYLTGFDYLCRESAIGCTALLDVFNTPNQDKESWYNVLLTGDAGKTLTLKLSSVESSNPKCTVPAGEGGCYVDVSGYSKSEITAAATDPVVFDASVVYIPSTTPSTTPLYLVANETASCNKVDQGCMWAGKETMTPMGPTHTTVLIKNDPEQYASGGSPILCKEREVGCDVFTSGKSTYYFKDPQVKGQKTCTYRSDVKKNGIPYSGWFWDGVGVCGTTTPKTQELKVGVCGESFLGITTKVDQPETQCTSDSSCGTGKKCVNRERIQCTADKNCNTGSVCISKGESACYPDYLQIGNSYGIWSFGTTDKYRDYVGNCPAKSSGCTQYVDHNDKDQPYYVLDNAKLISAKGSCSGQVSLKEGCVLFDQTDNPTKLWSTTSTYDNSKLNDNALVKPIKATSNNDSNLIMKVIRDRECGEWLQCKSSFRVWDKDLNKYVFMCQDVGRCNEVALKTDESDKKILANCSNWVDFNHEYSAQILDDKLYRSRDIDWKGMEFSGHSLLGVYPLEELVQFNMAKSGAKEEQWRLLKLIACGGNNCGKDILGKTVNNTSYVCEINKITNDSTCGLANSGTCYNNVCVQTPTGQKLDITNTAPQMECRAYPEETAPFPNTKKLGNSVLYKKVNLCEENDRRWDEDDGSTIVGPSVGTDRRYTAVEKDSSACDCSYTKVSYGSGGAITKYWNLEDPLRYPQNYGLSSLQTGNIPQGFCQGGTLDATKTCTKDSDCLGGSCSLATESLQLVGRQGYCLERDYSRYLNGDKNERPCLTWYPINSLLGTTDLYSTPEAGYQVSKYGKYYCSNSDSNFSPSIHLGHRILLNDHGYSCVESYKIAKIIDQFDLANPGPSSDYCHPLNNPACVGPDCKHACANGAFETASTKWNPNDFIFLCDEPVSVGQISYCFAAPGPYNCSNISCKKGHWELDRTGFKYSNLTIPDRVAATRAAITDCARQIQLTYTKKTEVKWGMPLDINFNSHNAQTGSMVVLKKPVNAPQVDYRRKINIKDVDQLTVKILTRPHKTTGGTIYPPGASSNNVNGLPNELSANFVVRNGAVTDLKPVITEYSTKGCNVYHEGDSNKKSIEQCGTQLGSSQDHFEVGRMFWGDAVSRVFKLKNGKTVMRVIMADTDPSVSAMSKRAGFVESDSTASFIATTYEKGYGANGEKEAEKLCADVPNGLDIVEAMAVFGTDGYLEYTAVAACAGLKGNTKTTFWQSVYYFMTIDLDLREYCQEVTDVITDGAPQTNNLWKKKDLNLKSVNLTFSPQYSYSVAQSPFGALNITNAPTVFDKLFYSFRQNEANSRTSNLIGAPYGCSDDPLLGYCGGAVKSSNIDYTKQSSELTKNYPKAGGKDNLQYLFARASRTFLLEGSSSTDKYGSPSVSADSHFFVPMVSTTALYASSSDKYWGAYNSTEIESYYLRAPRVLSVSKFCQTGSETCLEGPEGITLNGSNIDDAVLYVQPAKVDLTFFAHADYNQMPLTKIQVDWGDSFFTKREGSFANKRGAVDGYCDTVKKTCHFKEVLATGNNNSAGGAPGWDTMSVDTGKTCSADYDCMYLDYCQEENASKKGVGATHFGQILDLTCDPEYFSFTHVYQCVKNVTTNYKQPGNSACPTALQKTGCCVFEPKVQVLDNWGWCNGLCVDRKSFDIGYFPLVDITGELDRDYNKCLACDKAKLTLPQYKYCVDLNCKYDTTAGEAGCYDGGWKDQVKNSQNKSVCDTNSFSCTDECTGNSGVKGAWTTSTIKVYVAPQ